MSRMPFSASCQPRQDAFGVVAATFSRLGRLDTPGEGWGVRSRFAA